MGTCLKLLGLATVLTSVFLGYVYRQLTVAPTIPTFDIGYWGPGSPVPDDKTIKKFSVNVSEYDLKDFQARLDNWRPPVDPLEDVGFQYGFNSKYLAKIVQFWKTKYDWRVREKLLNKYPQFTTQIGGLNIHFIHVKPAAADAKNKKVVPLLLLHGWPGSVREFYEFIPLLTKPRGDIVFEVIAPSLPGYGWSQGSSKKGMNMARVAVIFRELMLRLGHKRFYVQGGDWGSAIATVLSVLHPENVIGNHNNMCFVDGPLHMMLSFFATFFPSFFVNESATAAFTSQYSYLIEESGYFHLQATKPDTIGTGLTDSPVGLAAYILEKFSTWTNRNWRQLPDGGLEGYDKARLLDNVMIYWFSKSITTSVRFYAENFGSDYMSLRLSNAPVTIPQACARFDQEMVYPLDISLKHRYQNLVQLTDLKGGHFAAFEVPQTLADDVWSFVKTVETRKV